MFTSDEPTLLPEMALPRGACHRSVKRIAARKHCTIAEAVYCYNVAPKDDIDSATAPANKLYNYEVRVLGIDRVLHSEPGAIDIPYDVGDTCG